MPELMTDMGSSAETTASATACFQSRGESLQGRIGALSTLNKVPFKTIDFLSFWGTLKM